MTVKELKRQVEAQLVVAQKAQEDAERDQHRAKPQNAGGAVDEDRATRSDFGLAQSGVRGAAIAVTGARLEADVVRQRHQLALRQGEVPHGDTNRVRV